MRALPIVSTSAKTAVLALAALLAGFAPLARSQADPSEGHWEPYFLDTGLLGNPGDEPAVVFQQVIQLAPGTPWVRVHFVSAKIEKGSAVRVTSLLDSDSQTLNAVQLAQWGYGMAYLNGSEVLLELIAGPHTQANYLRIEQVFAGNVGVAAAPETICGSTDNRVPSSDARVARLDNGNCTAWLINNGSCANKCFLTAGHCGVAGGDIVEFNVPLSNPNCTLVVAAVADQYAVDGSTITSVNGGAGNDYAVFKCFENPMTGLTPFQAQGSAFTLASSIPSSGTARVTGHGRDGTPTNNAGGGNTASCVTCANPNGTRHKIQQTHTGAILAPSGSIVRYQVDTCPANSGSPVINESTGQAIAIHTHAGCSDPIGSTANRGTAVTLAALQTALSNTCGSCPSNDHCEGAIEILTGNPVSGNNSSATTSFVWPCGLGGKDLWYRWRATCTGSATFSLCDSGTTYDTTLQVFSGSCGGSLTSLGCNDDGCAVPTLASTLTVPVTQANSYLIRVGGFASATGTFVLTVTCGGPTLTTDFGDAPLGAGVAEHLNQQFGSERLGMVVTPDPETVTPAWFGDFGDDGIVSVSNLFPGSVSATIVVNARNPNATFVDFCRLWVRRTSLGIGWATGGDGLPSQTASVGPAGTTFTFGPFTHSATGAPSPYVRARLSFNTTGVSSSVGQGAYGEVEDYVLKGTGGATTTPASGGGGSDAGDAPLPYPPANSTFINSERLGTAVDGDALAPVGHPTAGVAAWNDDGADDDAIVRISGLKAGGVCTIVARARNPLGTFTDIVSGWMDFDGDGDWDEPGEAFSPVSGPVGPGGTTFTLGPLPVPATVTGPVATRLKLSFSTSSQAAHLASGASFTFGEIEDYLLPTTHGVGCNSSGGPVPLVWAVDEPRIGTTFALEHAQLVPGQAVRLILGLGFFPAGLDISAFGLPVPPGQCFLYPSFTPLFLIFPVGAATPAGTLTWLSATPNDITLVGATLHLQSAQDFFAPGYTTARTPLITVTIGLP